MPRFRHVVVGAGVPETTLSKLPVEVRVVQADWLSTLALEQLDKRRVCETQGFISVWGPWVDPEFAPFHSFLMLLVGCFAMFHHCFIAAYRAPSSRIKKNTNRYPSVFFHFFAPMGWAMANNIDQQTQQNHVVMGRKHFVSETQRAHDRWVR